MIRYLKWSQEHWADHCLKVEGMVKSFQRLSEKEEMNFPLAYSAKGHLLWQIARSGIRMSWEHLENGVKVTLDGSNHLQLCEFTFWVKRAWWEDKEWEEWQHNK